jgi:hypothetical protein
MDNHTNLQFESLNCCSILAKVINSEVQTGVKSAGWLNNITHSPAYCFGKSIGHWVVIAVNSGALSPMRGNDTTSWSISIIYLVKI